MGENTAIEWADHTFNPWIGCTKVSPGCDHCYAETRDRRKLLGPASHWGPGAPRHRTSPANWQLPRAWQRAADEFFAEHGRRQRVFCASQADVFDNEVDPAWRRDLFALIGETPDLDWLLLTKRIGNAIDMLPPSHLKAPWPNVWLGATIVNQAEANRDIPKLLATPAVLRFLSIEPMLGPVVLAMLHYDGITNINALTGDHGLAIPMQGRGEGVDWVIAGGESGPGARPMRPDWVSSLRDECEDAGVPFLFKQWGEYLPVHVDELDRVGYEYRRIGKKAAGRRLHGRTYDGFPSVRR